MNNFSCRQDLTPRQMCFSELDGFRHMAPEPGVQIWWAPDQCEHSHCQDWQWRVSLSPGACSPGDAQPGCMLGVTGELLYSTRHCLLVTAGKEGVQLCLVIFHCTPWLEEELRSADVSILLSQCKKKIQVEFGYFRSRVHHPLHALTVLKARISEPARGSIFILLFWVLSPFLPILLFLSACKTNYSKQSLIRAMLLNSWRIYLNCVGEDLERSHRNTTVGIRKFHLLGNQPSFIRPVPSDSGSERHNHLFQR